MTAAQFSGEIPMSHAPTALQVCQICKKTKSPHGGMVAELIRPSLLEFIKKRNTRVGQQGFHLFR
jgi:hypothetical protein